MADTSIGEGTRVAGHIAGEEDLSVFGAVEGSIHLSESLTLEPTGQISAEVKARSAVVSGRLNGTLTLGESLVIEESGIVEAEVETTSAIISGVLVGNINAREAVEITAEGRMVGNITTPRLIMADGAAFRGQIVMAGLENEPMPAGVAHETEARSPAARTRGRDRTTSASHNRLSRPAARSPRSANPIRRATTTTPAPVTTTRTTTPLRQTSVTKTAPATAAALAPTTATTTTTTVVVEEERAPEAEVAPATQQAPSSDDNTIMALLDVDAFAELGWNKGRSYLKARDLNLQYSGREGMVAAYSDYLVALRS